MPILSIFIEQELEGFFHSSTLPQLLQQPYPGIEPIIVAAIDHVFQFHLARRKCQYEIFSVNRFAIDCPKRRFNLLPAARPKHNTGAALTFFNDAAAPQETLRCAL